MKINIKRKIDDNVSSKKIVDYLLSDRGINDKEAFLNPPHPDKIKFSDIFTDSNKNLEKTFGLLIKLHKNKEQIIVYTDYDADGLTGGAILWETLNALGFNVMPYVPDRKSEGYGLSKKGIDRIKQQFNPALIITVDHGIVAQDKISYAKKLGIKVIITDHHSKNDIKHKDAFAVFHTDKLSGSGVAYFFSRALFDHFKILNTKYSILNTNFQNDYLSLAVIGTIADLVPLTGVSRSIVKHGLLAFNKVNRWGLKELLKEATIDNRKITPYEIGYIIAPRINAFGRLQHGIDALRLLCTTKRDKAFKLALKAGATNRARQQLVEQSFIEADQKVNPNDKIIIVKDDCWQEGIIGLIAGKLAEKYHRPVIAITKNNHEYKASVRSIPKLDIIKFLRSFEKNMLNVGGHKQAAGFSVDEKNLNKLITLIKKKADKEISQSILQKSIYADFSVPLSLINLSLARDLEKLSPFGIGNPQPLFYSTGKLVEKRLLGKNNNHLKIKVVTEGYHFLNLIFFNNKNAWDGLITGSKINTIYQLKIDRWGGNEKITGIGKYII